jgi:septal ring factor EnvC (AmiA/AmiB activator)
MLLTDPANRALYDRLVDLLGEEHAVTLVRHLQPPPDELATKADTARLERRLDRVEQRLDVVEQRLDVVEQRLDVVEQRLGAMEQRLGAMEQRLIAVEQRLGVVEERLIGFERRLERFEDKLDGFHQGLRDQTRIFVLAQVSTVVAVAGVIFGAISLI